MRAGTGDIRACVRSGRRPYAAGHGGGYPTYSDSSTVPTAEALRRTGSPTCEMFQCRQDGGGYVRLYTELMKEARREQAAFERYAAAKAL